MIMQPTNKEFLQNRNREIQIDLNNSKLKAKQKEIVFGNYSWIGFARNLPYTRMPEGYSVSCVNTLPNYGYIEKPLGYKQVGQHQEVEIETSVYKGLVGGEYCSEFSRIEKKTSEEVALFKITKNRITGETQFWVLGLDGFWRPEQPLDDYYLQDGSVNPNAKKKYDFKGETFGYVVYKECLYLCSGKEDFLGSNGKRNGLLKFDGSVWDSIDCGMCGFPKNLSNYVNKTALITDNSGTTFPPNYRLYDGAEEFNPSIVVLYKERLFIGGANSNPIQVKMSEFNNPDNFVDNVLGLQTTALTGADTARPSSFILSEGCQAIKAMQVYNDSIFIGTESSWYIYSLVDIDNGENTKFQLDGIVKNNYTSSGTTSQYATTVFQNKLIYASDYQVIPEISNFELEFGSANAKPVAGYKKISSFIDDFMENVGLSKACIGVYGDKILVGCNYGKTDEGNNITVICTPFTLNASGITWGFSILDYIQPTFFFSNNNGCYFTEETSGELYKLIPTDYPVNKSAENVRQPTALWTTGWSGYNPAKDSMTSEKVLKKMLMYGYFSKGTEIFITFTPDNSLSETDSSSKARTIKYVCDKEDSPTDSSCSLDAGLNPEISYLYQAPYYSLNWNFPVGQDVIKYKSLNIKIEIKNSRYFRVENFIGLSQEISSDGNCEIIKPTFVDDLPNNC